MLRLRQIALVAADLDAVAQQLTGHLGLTACFNDPGVAEFGLRNVLYPIGDQLLEVVSPIREGTAAGRLLDKRGGDGGYMVLFETSDLEAQMLPIERADVRVVWSIDLTDIRGRHLHPGDVGGAIVSIDHPATQGSWRWAGPTWKPHIHDTVVNAIAGATIGAADPTRMQARWTELGIATSIAFQQASARGDGLDVVDLVAIDRSAAGSSSHICGVTFRLV
jgi:hypothetical protein